MYVCMFVYVYVCMHACMYVCLCMCVCMYVCMYVCVVACTCIEEGLDAAGSGGRLGGMKGLRKRFSPQLPHLHFLSLWPLHVQPWGLHNLWVQAEG